jgi:DNA-binding XRE family transcriptional regulator
MKAKKRGPVEGTPKKNLKAVDTSALDPIKANICRNIRKIRLEAGITMQEFADTLNLDRVYINGVERGKFVPSPKVLYEISKKYRRTLDWIFSGK